MRKRTWIVCSMLCMLVPGAAMSAAKDANTTDAPTKMGSQVITLEANPTTGYEWTYMVEGTAVTLEDLGIGEPKNDVLGAPSAQSFLVQAVEPGTATITFTYARSWEPESSQQDVMEATVDKSGTLDLTDVTDTRVMWMEGLGTDEVLVVLESNPTTGFEWQVKAEGAVLVKDQGYLPDETEEGMVGAGGEEIFSVTGTNAGAATLIFTYVQPWEEDDPPVNTITLRLTVDKDGNLTKTE